ncbi:MAG: hypothetical protein HY862_04750 [Chloroflexi bacterium]|nr:hypothetical protein [Chloroflexota bacterium]
MHTYIAKELEKIGYKPYALPNGEQIHSWNGLRVGIFRVEDGREEQVGEYVRQYRTLYDTFFHFVQDGKDYALYSPNYSATRLLELPSSKDIGGEEPAANGFCPTQYYVPSYIIEESYYERDKKTTRNRITEPRPEQLAPRSFPLETSKDAEGNLVTYKVHLKPLEQRYFDPFGFVAGCVWGDDNSWKIQYLDLSEASKGILKREERFGYIVLPLNQKLRDAIDMEDFQHDFDKDDTSIYINVRKRFDIETGDMSDF